MFSFCVCFKESCEGVCRWLNLTLYNRLGTAQLLVSVLRGAIVETDSFCCVFGGFFFFENVKKFGLKCRGETSPERQGRASWIISDQFGHGCSLVD